MTEQRFYDPTRGRRCSVAQKSGHAGSLLRRLPVETYVIAFTIALWIALSLPTPNFLTEGNVTNMMRQTSIAAIIAIGVHVHDRDCWHRSFGGLGGRVLRRCLRPDVLAMASALAPSALLTLLAGVVVGFDQRRWRSRDSAFPLSSSHSLGFRSIAASRFCYLEA